MIVVTLSAVFFITNTSKYARVSSVWSFYDTIAGYCLQNVTLTKILKRSLGAKSTVCWSGLGTERALKASVRSE